MRRAIWLVIVGVVACVACGPGPRGNGDGAGDDAIDAQPFVDAPVVDLCHVVDDDNGLPACTDQAPPGSFEPEIQWSWPGQGVDTFSIVTPLVANMTDDNGDGEINLCDIPDVLVVASPSSGAPGTTGHIYLLDGQTGTMQRQFPTDVDHSVTPALGDLDGDSIVEVVTATPGGQFIAFEHTGEVKWTSTTTWPEAYSGAIALADIDEDGDIEIVGGNIVLDHAGVWLWTAPQPAGSWSATAIANLDGAPGMEIVLGHAAYHADGSPYYVAPAIQPGYPQVANLDADPAPEVLIANSNGLSLLNHDGTVIWQDRRPTGVPVDWTAWLRPAVIHDVDADGSPEFAMSSQSFYTVYRPDASIVWSATVSDQSGIAGGTAFDFLGDGSAEAMYADESTMFVFGPGGTPLMSTPRTSGTLSEYPVVADIDNDGSAEIVVVSNQYLGTPSPTVQVIRDREDRWIQARRIWNEHTYHVTNVREDGTIPQHEVPSWTRLNTFRSNAQISEGGVCNPVIE